MVFSNLVSSWCNVSCGVMVFQLVCVLRGGFGRALSLFVGCPTGQSVIEEKGEGFENGKIFVGLLVLPSTSIALTS